MISADRFCDELAERRIGLVSGVPCSYFSVPIERLTRERRYVPAANEGAALAIAAGAAVAGTRSAVIAQNSGLGNLINPLTSLLTTYRIPVLVFMSLRGWPDPADDEPQHAVMGTATHGLLEAIDVAAWTLRRSATTLTDLLDAAEPELAQGRPAFILAEKGAIETRPAAPARPNPVSDGPATLTRAEVLALVMPRLAGLPVVSTTGYTSRELFGHGDRPDQFYMQGSMGHAGAFGLGVALATDRPVVVLDGDGAALMHLGTVSTIGSRAPLPMLHVIFDNGAYESTGAQLTTSSTTDFAGIARAAGYLSARTCTTAAEVTAAIDAALAGSGPHLVVARVLTRSGPVPARATSAVTAVEMHRRFGTALGADAAWARPVPVPS